MSGRTAKRYEKHRQAAIRAAAAVFVEKGFHGSSTRDIAERLGIKQGSLYYYFKSKEQALSEVCLFGIRDYVGHMTEIAAGDEPFEAKIEATVRSHLTAYRERSEALKVYNDERLYLPAAKRRRLKALGTRYRRELESIFVAAKEEGVVRDPVDPHFAAQAVIGLCNAFGDLIVRRRGPNLDETIQKCTDLLINGFIREQQGRKL
jgi:AcrR family transcriptional regulator